MPRLPRPENSRLKALLAEAQMSNKGLARRVVDLAAARGIAGVRCDHTSVLRWLAGEQPATRYLSSSRRCLATRSPAGCRSQRWA